MFKYNMHNSVELVEKFISFCSKMLVSMLGVGFFPGSGTIASFVTVVISLLVFLEKFTKVGEITTIYYLSYALPLILICYILVWIHSLFVTHKDQSYIVLDEVAGQIVALSTSANNLVDIILAFVIFRLLDIYKPWPISLIDSNKRSVNATMADDLVAGAATAIIILVIRPVLSMIRIYNALYLPGLV